MSLLVALIIGPGDELEDEIAYQLGKKGICIISCSNNEDKFERMIQKLNNEDIEPKFFIFNPVNFKTIDEVIGKIDEQFGKLDMLINVRILLDNNQFKINTMLYEGFEARESLDILTVSQAFIPLLQKSHSSCIINIYDEISDDDSDMKLCSKLLRDYSARFEFSKFMDQFHKEFSHTNIKINLIILGDDHNIQTIAEEADRIVHSITLPFLESSKSKTMRILYGIVGEGMGHATRSKVTLEILMKEHHHVKVVVSNRAYKFLHDNFSNRFPRCDEASEGEAAIDIIEIEGFTMQYVNNVFDEKASVVHTMERMPDMLGKNLDVYQEKLLSWMPEAAISDFDSFAYIFAKAHGIPILSIDNQHVVQRCVIPDEAKEPDPLAFYTYKCFVKAKLSRCNYYIITGFFTPEIRDKYKDNTLVVPPILRQTILDAKQIPVEHCEHFLVYQTSKSDTSLVPILQAFGEKCIVYGLGREEKFDNLEFKGFSEQGFVNDLASAKGVIANGGLSLMNEAVSLQRPFFSVPVENQYEQVLNAWYLQKLGYGVFADKI
ncbi:unnamed protein product [Rotaria sp. Silwood1]|nr:unnamed protein product [Rotaria sp. Silwood1]CAF1631634.1 unnamed protein product [Rotaria sp. Silwood1]CAF3765782.1 unnamed protein product [Rotaria sp. Silwood1]CAF4977924.1 unnamed protein product [Rotaria sp. Silwood1]